MKNHHQISAVPAHRSSRWIVVSAVLLAGALVLAGAGPAAAQRSQYSFTAALSGSIGGTLDASAPDPGVGNTGFQLAFMWETLPKTRVGLRYGQVDFSDEQIGTLFDPELSYVTIAGEYLYQESYFLSGIYIGLGYYSLEGDRLVAGDEDESALGAVLGVSGDFEINERFSILAELSMHWADLTATQLFGFGHLGVAYRF